MSERKIIGIVEENHNFAIAMKRTIQEHLSLDQSSQPVEIKIIPPDLSSIESDEEPDIWIVGLLVGADFGEQPYYEQISPIIAQSGKPTIKYSMYRLFTAEQNSDSFPDITFSENEPFESLLDLVKTKLSNDST